MNISTRTHLLSISLIVLIAGCASSSGDSRPQRSPDAGTIRSFGSDSDTVFRYLILGDSTAVGVGGSYEEGIAVTTSRHLARERGIAMMNLAVSGAQVTDVLHEQLPRIGGFFIPDVVLLDVGANDVTHLTGAGSLEDDLRAILQSLIAMNCNVKIVLTGAADMTTPPRIPWVLRGLAGWRTRTLNEVFEREAERFELTFAPIARETGPLFAEDPTLFSEDEFHPNDRGYETWITVIEASLDRALASQPSHCRR